MRCIVVVLTSVICAFAGVAHAQTAPHDEPAVKAVNKVLPAVVNINTERIVRHAVMSPYDALFYEFFGGTGRPTREYRQKVRSLGSGFIVDSSGLIVTNEHVVERAADLKIRVTTPDGADYVARYIAGDEDLDLAIIKIESDEPLPFVSLDDLSPNLLGQSVLVLGNPLGYGSSVSKGILSATDRSIVVEEREYKALVQTDAAINPGNSGGPVIDIEGKLVGVSSVKMAYTPQGVPTQGIGFAISAENVRDAVARLKKQAATPQALAVEAPLSHRFFGLQLQDLTPDLARALGYRNVGAGVLIADVEKGSPAEFGGLKRGLVIRQVGRYQVTSSADIETLLERIQSGSSVDFAVEVLQMVGGIARSQLLTVNLTAR
jgi:serine protease Do